MYLLKPSIYLLPKILNSPNCEIHIIAKSHSGFMFESIVGNLKVLGNDNIVRTFTVVYTFPAN